VSNHIQVGVIGSAQVSPANLNQASLEEILNTLTHAALKNAGMTIDDIDGIVVAACDQLDGRAISIMAASGSVGGVGRDILSTPSGSEHAFILGALRVKSGMYKTQLVLSWSPLEVDSICEIQKLSNDPYYHRALPQDDLSTYALQAGVLESEVSGVRESVIKFTQQSREKGRVAYPNISATPVQEVQIRDSKMLRWPITEGMVCEPRFGAVAMVLSNQDWIKDKQIKNPAWIHGMGWATETTYLGDRNLSDMGSLKAAAHQAYHESGISDPKSAFDVVEVSDPTGYQALLSLDGLGLCDSKDWRDAVHSDRFSSKGSLPVNLSGGATSFNPVFCTGLLRLAEAANQVRGCAGAHQKSGVRKSLGHGSSGFAMQYNSVVVFANLPKENQL